MRVAFLGSPPFATPTFEALLASRHEVVALVTRPERPRGRGRRTQRSPLVEAAEARGIPVLTPERARDAGFQAELRALAPEALLVASFGQILDQATLDLAPRGAFNVHGSLLPRHRGAAPIQAAIRAGDARTGVSVQRVVLALDEGDVLLERAIEIGPEETAGELFERLAELGAGAAVEALDLVEDGRAVFQPQDPAAATYAKRLAKDDGRVDWRLPAEELARHVRAMTPWPGARARLADGRDLTINRACAIDGQGEPGALLESSTRLVVATGDGALELLELTPAGKRTQAAADWLRGARLDTGARFEVPA